MQTKIHCMNGKLHKNNLYHNLLLIKSGLASLSIVVFLTACQENGNKKLYNLSAQTEEGITAIIEIPAGTNKKIEFNTSSKKFEIDRIDGKERIVDFLPYPGNYGFIPSTYMDAERGGDGDALDILVISESQPTGTAMTTQPIGALMLLDDNEIDTKIIAVPVDTSLQIIKANTFKELLIDYDVAKRMIEDWFLTYKGIGRTQLIGWRDEVEALNEINKWAVK